MRWAVLLTVTPLSYFTACYDAAESVFLHSIESTATLPARQGHRENASVHVSGIRLIPNIVP
jgi:hypothetical protein